MAQVVYNGGFDAVDVPLFDLYGIERGVATEVADGQAEALCASPDWSVVKPSGKGNPPADLPADKEASSS